MNDDLIALRASVIELRHTYELMKLNFDQMKALTERLKLAIDDTEWGKQNVL